MPEMIATTIVTIVFQCPTLTFQSKCNVGVIEIIIENITSEVKKAPQPPNCKNKKRRV